MDRVSKSERSRIMSLVKSKDTKIEEIVRKIFQAAGLRYRKNQQGYFGKPDLVFTKYKTVVFVDSCFWHGCRKHFRLPNTNQTYWKTKIDNNKKRDRKVNSYYKKYGWLVVRIWEHNLSVTQKTLQKIISHDISKVVTVAMT
jgi:DNA mismatch endonuclease (patch repair protein)